MVADVQFAISAVVVIMAIALAINAWGWVIGRCLSMLFEGKGIVSVVGFLLLLFQLFLVVLFFVMVRRYA